MAMQDEVELLQFATQKLLNGASTLHGDKTGSGVLACLCVRFALEFNADPSSREVACTQVERHMRLCLAATAGFERLITIAGSEPLLAEAASRLTGGDLKKPVDHLASVLDLDCIDRGRRGELVATMMIMQARDEASAREGSRWISVKSFMEALLSQDKYEDLLNSVPTARRKEGDMPFGETFENYAMWFNHVIRIMDRKAINSKNLWTYITRGAMVVCTHYQPGVDIVLPLCLKTGNISGNNVSAILIQVKNAKQYGRTIDKRLFDAMDPVSVGLFDDNTSQRPIIRMVFALAAPDEDKDEGKDEGKDEDDESAHPKKKRPKTDAVSLPLPRAPHSARGDNGLTTFDIWCAGLSKKTFRGNPDDLTSYKVVLDRLLQVDEVFKLQETKDIFLDDKTRSLRESLRRRMSALTILQDDHRRLHV